MLDIPDPLTGLLCCKQCGCSHFLQIKSERIGVSVVDGAAFQIAPYPLTKRFQLVCRQCDSQVPPEFMKHFKALEFAAYDPVEN